LIQIQIDRAGVLPGLFLTEHLIDRIDGVGHGDTLEGDPIAVLQCLAVEGVDETIDAFRAAIDIPVDCLTARLFEYCVPIGRIGCATGRRLRS
jgi:hypothetical protein